MWSYLRTGWLTNKGKEYLEKLKIFEIRPKNQKVIAEGKVSYSSTYMGAEAWLGEKDDGFVVGKRLVSKLYRYRGKNIKLIVEIVEEEK